MINNYWTKALEEYLYRESLSFLFHGLQTSGVDIEAGREFVSEIKQAVEGTHTPNVIDGIGGLEVCLEFHRLFKTSSCFRTDGVGTKLELAQNKNFHFEVGIDLVAMCRTISLLAVQNLYFFLIILLL